MTNSHVADDPGEPDAFYAVTAGVWFTAARSPAVAIATSVPPVIYTIPPSSPIYYVTYVRIYEATPQVVYVGYTPGYLGTVVAPYGTVVYGTGYAYSPWIGSVWYRAAVHLRRRRGADLQPVRRLHVRLRDGPRHGGVDVRRAGAVRYYYPAYWGGYGCCATASANVYGHWGNDDLVGHALVVRGRRRRRHTFERQLLQQPHAARRAAINAGRQFNA